MTKRFPVSIIYLFILPFFFVSCATSIGSNIEQIPGSDPSISYLKIKWHGTALIMLEHDGTLLLFDPFITINNKLHKPSTDELASADAILVTHGHFDHIADIPAVLEKANKQPVVYCTKIPAETLASRSITRERINIITPNDELRLGSFYIRVLKGKHIVFDKGLRFTKIISPRNIFYMGNLIYISGESKNLDEAAAETVAYDISVEDKRILLLGSLNLDDDTEYPTGVDLLILPLQGRSDIAKYAMTIVDRIQPKKILLDHFDDSFPPISSSVNPGPFIKLMEQKYPDIPVVYLSPGTDAFF